MKNSQIKDVIKEVKKAIIGKDSVIELAMTAILAGGHILIEDIPGVGKTTLALAFSKAMNLEGKRMQFTPDVMPSDLTGFSVYNKNSGSLEYKEGALCCNLFLGDEINRTSPKTQSALLEAMEEGKISVDGITRKLPEPFIVIATQNPIGSAGTQDLPESQLDRFMVRLSMGYPDFDSEFQVIKNGGSDTLSKVDDVINSEDLNLIKRDVRNIFIDEKILNYILELVSKTRKNEFIRLGLSPRGTLALTDMAKAYAMLCERDFVIPEDVQRVFSSVICHRIILEPRAKIEGLNSSDIANSILKETGKVEIV
ncbi:AAA family ATPase [Anaerovorax odorimutans]|uniref:AAA family ATPase n=1 Tax=Anaerovorax odorimutans TaxID=109327 RepID=UPI000404FF97|nr:MoxR family ATPase [Anaerovorax odorimutans]